jgi:hypothetical protein
MLILGDTHNKVLHDRLRKLRLELLRTSGDQWAIRRILAFKVFGNLNRVGDKFACVGVIDRGERISGCGTIRQGTCWWCTQLFERFLDVHIVNPYGLVRDPLVVQDEPNNGVRDITTRSF